MPIPFEVTEARRGFLIHLAFGGRAASRWWLFVSSLALREWNTRFPRPIWARNIIDGVNHICDFPEEYADSEDEF